MKREISYQILDILKAVGVKRMFGIPGDTIDTMLNAINKDKDLEFIVSRHEENAAFMASGEARITDNLGVVLSAQGPGANNLLNGLADAASDRIPVLAITGQVNTDFIGRGMPQESNQLKIFDDVAIFNAEARSPENLIEILHLAIDAALSQGGVAHISIPSDIMLMKEVHHPVYTFSRKSDNTLIPNETHVDAAVEEINKASKLAILYGEGGREASKELIALSELLKAPLVHTTRSKDIIDNNHPNIRGGIGIMGSHPANKALHDSDLLIVVGSNFAWKDFYPDTPIIKIDNNPLHMSSPIPTRHPICADAKPTLELLLKKLKQRTDDSFLESSANVMSRHIDELLFDNKASKDGKIIHPAAIVEKITSSLEDDAIVVGDSGSTTIWINNIAKFNGKQRFLWSATLATLGSSIGHSIGASFAAPDKQIVLIAGDGGFQMAIQDLVTAAMYNRPIKCFILNNSTYKFIEFEEASHDGNAPSGTKFLNPDYAALAEACWCKGFTINNYSEIDSVIAAAMAHDGPVVVDCKVDPDALLIPPAVTPKMAANYAKSMIKSWFSIHSDDEKRLEEFAKKHKK